VQPFAAGSQTAQCGAGVVDACAALRLLDARIDAALAAAD
jgi:hypothetical protein